MPLDAAVPSAYHCSKVSFGVLLTERSCAVVKYKALALYIAAGLAVAGLMGGCAKQSDDIVIGEFGPFQGGIADFGKTMDQGVSLAIDEINGGGGILGKKVQLKKADDRSEASEALSAVEKLITKDRVVGVIGEVASTNTWTAAPAAQTNKVPFITPASTNPKVTTVGDYIFRVCFTDDFQGSVCAVFARRNLRMTNAAIFRDVKSDYSKGLADAFKKTFEESGGKVIVDTTYSQGDRDFKSQLTTIKAAKPQIIFIPGYYTEVSLIASQARQLGIDTPLLGGDGWDSDTLVPSAGKALEGCYFSNHFTAQDTHPATVKFVTAFRKKYNVEPNAFAALGYDAAWIMAEAIKKAGSTDGEAIRKALSEMTEYPGATGRITIDKNRNASKPAVVLQIKGNKFVRFTTIGPEQVQ